MEDLNEANFTHLLTNLSNNKDIDSQYAAALSVIHELISVINYRIFNLNKKSKKNSRSNEQPKQSNASGREIDRR
ncbi:IMV protein [NY_014 poxvirus]|uniref:IMV protein n=1 Tax=NY_014 poxvirus TaxID=2025360 RepID=UPI000B99F663|nr:IMV protein [NY_014 poxvirus]AST09543.1 IMV protein [NY_014 poxvirus]